MAFEIRLYSYRRQLWFLPDNKLFLEHVDHVNALNVGGESMLPLMFSGASIVNIDERYYYTNAIDTYCGRGKNVKS